MTAGLRAVEALLVESKAMGRFCCGDQPTIADICLVAQCFASRRFNIPTGDFENIARIDTLCRALPAFKAAAPDVQADFEA